MSVHHCLLHFSVAGDVELIASDMA